MAVPRATIRSGIGSPLGRPRTSRASLASSFEFELISLHQFDDQGFLRLEVVVEAPGRIPQASAISFSDVRRPDEANRTAAVSKISVLRPPLLVTVSHSLRLTC